MLRGMSQPPQPPTARTPDIRWLLALVTVSLGGYMLVLSLSGQFIQLFTGMPIDVSYGVLLTLQLIFALAVVVLGFFFAPAPLMRRAIAAGIVVAIVLLVIVLQAIRLSSGFGPASVFIGLTLGDSFVMLALGLGSGWLVVRKRPGLSFATLALAVILSLVRWGLVLNGFDLATSHHARSGRTRGGGHRLGWSPGVESAGRSLIRCTAAVGAATPAAAAVRSARSAAAAVRSPIAPPAALRAAE
jgi:hypothetical protein